MSLIVVGSVAFDAIETPFGKTDKILGGAGTFISITASYFEKNPKLVSVVGYDFPKEYIDILNQHSIITEGLQIKTDEKTFFWAGKYHTDMNIRDTLITELNSLGTFNPIVPDSYQNSDFLMLGNLSPVVQRKVIEQLKRKPKLIAMDTMNFWMNTAMDELLKTLSLVDVLIINDEEARQLSGEYFLPLAAEKIFKMGPKYLIIKKGEHGAMLFGPSDSLFDKTEVFAAPALPLSTVCDPTGAGDTFAGGFIGYLANCKEVSFEKMKTAVIVGSAMASFTVEGFGTTKIRELNQMNIFERIGQFVKLTHFETPQL